MEYGVIAWSCLPVVLCNTAMSSKEVHYDLFNR